MGGGDKNSVPQGYTGNIDLTQRPIVYNPDGSVSTEKSFSINEDGKEILLPSVINGRVVSEKDAIKHYHKTGEHLGVYPSVDASNEIANRIHSRPITIIPDTGAAKYWYVDPRAQQEPNGQQAVLEALSRIGVSEASQPSF